MTVRERRSCYVKITLSFYVIWLTLYTLEGFYAVRLPVTDLTLWIDNQIPVVPGFVWIYMSVYLFPVLAIALVRNWHRVNLALLSVTLCTLLAVMVHLAIPVAFPRPSLGSSLSERVLAFLYSHDFQPGAQQFPSLHVVIALVLYWTCRGQGLSRFAESAILALALLIVASTILVKQHLVIDSVGGVLLAIVVWRFLSRVYHRSVSPEEEPVTALTGMTRKLAPLYAFCALCALGVGVARAIR